jgi:hypothetical protein
MASVSWLDRTGVGPTRRSRSTSRTDLVTILLGMWVVLGLVADGNTHVNTPQLETFFTPSHAVLYSGYLSAAAWMGWQVLRQWRQGHHGLEAVPVGYGLGLVGAAIFGLGGLADLAWHALFGIEADIDALLSPSHLVLFVGAALILTTPWRAASSAAAGEAPGFRAFLPVLLSATATVMFVAFFVLYLSPFTAGAPTATAARAAGFITHRQQEVFWSQGIAGVLVTTAVLLVPLLLLVRRWTVPTGTATILFFTVALLSSAIYDFEQGALILAAPIGGLLADLLISRLRPSAARPVALWTVAAVVPAALWAPYFAVVAGWYGLAWPAELWSGSVVLSSLAGLALGLLATPPAGSAVASPGGKPGGDSTRPARTSLTKHEQEEHLSW